MRYCPSLIPAFLAGELFCISVTGKYVSKTSSYLSFLIVKPIASLLDEGMILGVI